MKQAIVSIVVGAALLAGAVPWAGSGLAHAGLPDLFGKAQPPLPKGALQVQDLEPIRKAIPAAFWCAASSRKSRPTTRNCSP
ncbi:hypothetical protein [Pseudomonas aeruginosa]|uniref:hypothetical protein n=1 Tax=Pseudomonas aeruginosa TaxID=287 RepID=UPI003FD57573